MTGFIQRSRKGFTLTEMLIVLLIIGLLLVIGMPTFIHARDGSRTRSCVRNLRQIESAKEQWAMETRAPLTAVPRPTDLFGPSLYIETPPVCPSGGTYVIQSLSSRPVCTIGDHGTPADPSDAHTLP